LDIETAPNLVHVWGLWQQNVGINQIIDAGYVMCWACKWYGTDEIMFDSVHKSKPAVMLRRIHKLLDEADAVIHYNGTSFDIPTLNKEFLVHGMFPPSPYKQVDLFRVAKSSFRFPSKKLDYIAKALGLGEKTKHEGHELWIKCMADDESAWERMETYNRNDVVLLEAVYERMRPWVRTHPNVAVYDEPGLPVCPTCGSGKVQRRGVYITVAQKYTRMHCQECGKWSRDTHNEIPKEDRANILRPVS
jgi:hypothetical protein